MYDLYLIASANYRVAKREIKAQIRYYVAFLGTYNRQKRRNLMVGGIISTKILAYSRDTVFFVSIEHKQHRERTTKRERERTTKQP